MSLCCLLLLKERYSWTDAWFPCPNWWHYWHSTSGCLFLLCFEALSINCLWRVTQNGFQVLEHKKNKCDTYLTCIKKTFIQSYKRGSWCFTDHCSVWVAHGDDVLYCGMFCEEGESHRIQMLSTKLLIHTR